VFKASSGGDISFYEDTGTTPKFFWDASAERLGIGTSSPSARLEVFDTSAAAATSLVQLTGQNNYEFNIQSVTTTNSTVGARYNFAINSSNGEFSWSNSGGERLRITSAGNVGIGVISPLSRLHIENTSGNDGIRIINSTTGEGYIVFGDTADSNTGAIAYNHTSDAMTFDVNNSERARIDASGNLLVATTNANPVTSNTAGISLGADKIYRATVVSGPAMALNRSTSDGDIIDFRKDGTTVGSIGTFAGDLTIGDADVGIRFDTGTGLVPWNVSTNAATDNAIDIGASTARFKDLYLSGGVYLGGTGSANLLDDYEEGTWTATMGCTGNATTTTTKTGFYTKVGRKVTVSFRNLDDIDTTGLSGFLAVSLPFTCVSADVGFVGGVSFDNLVYPADVIEIKSTVTNGGTNAVFGLTGDNVALTFLGATAPTSGTTDIAYFTLTYFTA
jgi:hypothetical protein